MLLPDPCLQRMRAQYGLITRRQYRDLGDHLPGFDSMVHRRALERLYRGVYRWPGSAEPPEQRLLAAALRSGRGARIDGELAAALHGLEGCSLAAPLSIVIPSHRRVTGVSFDVRPEDVHPGDRATVRVIPTVTVARALIVMAAGGITKEWRVSYDSGRRLGLITVPWLRRRALASPGLPGAELVLDFLATPDAAPESEGERALGAVLAHAPVQPEWGAWLLPGIRVDAVYRRARIVLEYDGRDWHTLDTDIAADLERQRRLEEAGWLVIRVTRRMLRDDPVGTVAMIERLRRERDAVLGA